MLAWFHGRPGRNGVTLSEKVGIAVNLVVAAVVLALAFSGTDLGAAVTRVSVQNEDGETIERAIPRAETQAAAFPVDTGPGLGEDDAQVAFVASEALTFDWLPDDFFDPVGSDPGIADLREAGFDGPRNVPLSLKREVAEEHHAEFLASGASTVRPICTKSHCTVHGVDRGSLN